MTVYAIALSHDGKVKVECVNAAGPVDALRAHSMFRDMAAAPDTDLDLERVAKLGESDDDYRYMTKVLGECEFDYDITQVPTSAHVAENIPVETLERRSRRGVEGVVARPASPPPVAPTLSSGQRSVPAVEKPPAFSTTPPVKK